MSNDLAAKLRLLQSDSNASTVPPPAKPSRSGPNYRLIGGALLLAVLMFAAGLFWGGSGGPQPAEAPAQKAAVAPTPAPGELVAAGFVVARRRATIAAQITGQVEALLVEEGQFVRRGQLLARLDADAADAATDNAREVAAAARAEIDRVGADLEEARRVLARTENLTRRGFARPADLTRSAATVSSLDAQLARARSGHAAALANARSARVNRDRFSIRAPFDGIVVDISAQPGEVISPISAGGGFTRTGICTIVDMNSLEIEVDVSEAYISRVSPGQNVRAVLDAYQGSDYRGAVIAVVPIADRSRATFRVRIRLDAPDRRVLPEMAVRVTFLEGGAAPPGGRAR